MTVLEVGWVEGLDGTSDGPDRAVSGVSPGSIQCRAGPETGPQVAAALLLAREVAAGGVTVRPGGCVKEGFDVRQHWQNWGSFGSAVDS